MEMPDSVARGRYPIGSIAWGSFSAKGLVAAGAFNAIGLVAVSFLNAMGLVTIGPVNSMRFVAIGGVNAVGVVAIGGVNSVGLVATGGLNSTGIRRCWRQRQEPPARVLGLRTDMRGRERPRRLHDNCSLPSRTPASYTIPNGPAPPTGWPARVSARRGFPQHLPPPNIYALNLPKPA